MPAVSPRAHKAPPPRGIGPRNLEIWYYMVGIEKSAPERMPVGQRDVMVFNLV
jgi:hypothetical protein